MCLFIFLTRQYFTVNPLYTPKQVLVLNAELGRNLIASDLFSVHLWAIDRLNLKLSTLCRHTASLKI